METDARSAECGAQVSDASEPTCWTDLEIIDVVTCTGKRPAFVDLNICRAKTREYPPGRVDHVLVELRTAYASDCARRGFTPWDCV